MRTTQTFVPPRIQPEALTAWRRLTIEQQGLATREQLRGLGITAASINANVDAGRWRHVLPRVYATFTGPLPRSALIVAALLYAGPAALLSHRTAAEEWGMLDRGDGPVHVTVPYGCSAVSQPPLVVVHRSRAFRHLVVRSEPARVGRADTAVDLATAEPTARLAMRRLIAVTTGSRISLTELRQRIEERRPHRYRNAINSALSLMAGGVCSALEGLFAVDVEAAHALPTARRQVPFRVDGHTLWEDATYDHIGVPLTIRLDGRRYHSHPDVAFRDRRRDYAAELADRRRLVYGWHDVDADPCAVAAEVATVLRRCGWQGSLRRCGRCGGPVDKS
jgi:hypothetical protein